jgi:hypothetical protein
VFKTCGIDVAASRIAHELKLKATDNLQNQPVQREIKIMSSSYHFLPMHYNRYRLHSR